MTSALTSTVTVLTSQNTDTDSLCGVHQPNVLVTLRCQDAMTASATRTTSVLAPAGQPVTVPSVSCPIACQFPDSKVCRLHFVMGSHTVTDGDDIFVSQLEKEGRMDQLENLNKSFKVTDITVDTPNHVIVVKKKGRKLSPEIGQQWVADVRQKIHDVLGTVESLVIDTGRKSEDIQRALVSCPKFAHSKLSCLLSTNNQSLLLLCSHVQDVTRAKTFVETELQKRKSLPVGVKTPSLSAVPQLPTTTSRLTSTLCPQSADTVNRVTSAVPVLQTRKEHAGLTQSAPPVPVCLTKTSPTVPLPSDIETDGTLDAPTTQSDGQASLTSTSTTRGGQPCSMTSTGSLNDIRISSAQVKLLQHKDVKLELLSRLMDSQIVIDSSQIDRGIISVAHGDPSKARMIIDAIVRPSSAGTSSTGGQAVASGQGGILSQQKPPSSALVRGVSAAPRPNIMSSSDFVTSSGIRVSVYKKDITTLTVDAVVTGTTASLGLGGQAAAAIAKAAGKTLEQECHNYVRLHGPLKVTEVVLTTGGQLPCGHVLHAVCPPGPYHTDMALCQQQLTDTVFACLTTAHSQAFTTIALPSIGAAKCGIPMATCADSYLAAVKMLEVQYGGNTTLTHINFVDLNDSTVDTIRQTFTAKWNDFKTSNSLILAKTYKVSSTARQAVPSGQGGILIQQKPLFSAPARGVLAALRPSSTSSSDFVTSSGIRVSVFKRDITTLTVDAIIIGTTASLALGGKAAAAIANAAGITLEQECRNYVRLHGPLKVTEVVLTTGGQLPCSHVLHAVCPPGPYHTDMALCQQQLTDTVFACLTTAHSQAFTTIALPSIGAAKCGIPMATCAECYLAAVKMLEVQYGGNTTLTHIHFVDLNDSAVDTIRQTFTAKWNDFKTSNSLILAKTSSRIAANVLKPAQSVAQPSSSAVQRHDTAHTSPGRRMIGTITARQITVLSQPVCPLAQFVPAAQINRSKTDFVTRRGTRVSVYEADITELSVDAVVCATNRHFCLDSGVSLAIARRAGAAFRNEVQDYVARRGGLKVGQVVRACAGQLPCKVVVCAAGPRWKKYTDKALCRQQLVDTIFKCMYIAQHYKLVSIALPLISSGQFGVPEATCTQSYLSGIEKFDDRCPSTEMSVHFVDINKDKVRYLQQAFSQHSDLDVQGI